MLFKVFSRMAVGWQGPRSLRTDLAIDALEMAVHNRGRPPLARRPRHLDHLDAVASQETRAARALDPRIIDAAFAAVEGLLPPGPFDADLADWITLSDTRFTDTQKIGLAS